MIHLVLLPHVYTAKSMSWSKILRVYLPDLIEILYKERIKSILSPPSMYRSTISMYSGTMFGCVISRFYSFSEGNRDIIFGCHGLMTRVAQFPHQPYEKNTAFFFQLLLRFKINFAEPFPLKYLLPRILFDVNIILKINVVAVD